RNRMSDELFRKLYPVLEINKVVLLQTDIPREVIDSLTDQDMFWIAYHLYRWYSYDFLKVFERIATAYVDGMGWQWEYGQDPEIPTITRQPQTDDQATKKE